MKNQEVRKEDILNEKEFYKRKIIEMINQIENLDYLSFILNMLIAFKKKWGI